MDEDYMACASDEEMREMTQKVETKLNTTSKTTNLKELRKMYDSNEKALVAKVASLTLQVDKLKEAIKKKDRIISNLSEENF